MRHRNKLLWILTSANVAIALLVMLVILAMLSAFEAFAAEVSGEPLLVLLPIGEVLSLTGVLLSRRVDARILHRVGCFANGSALVFHSTILLGIVALFIAVPQERFLVPEGFMGDVYVIHSVADGEPEARTFRGVIYRIPHDGILRTQAPVDRGFTRSMYYYERGDGSLERVRNVWNTTIQRTPENVANAKDVGVFFPRTGTERLGPAGCPIEYDKFSIGTKAYLLSEYAETNLTQYLNEHPVKCKGSTN